ncbi:hypothetical protein TVAG_317300 [Trichomonas vaginalis G3]|uniref:CCR4-NOT transcription complex subunit 10 n=1 Tax=Trichomonas vaginalis (strain ATCC PRA-98 / G3) TaxID=412133 RepID=A2FR05_TRIV3|nr:regulation of translation [Trichomonas vaginalis G3]EAX92672.1 hypothetical protein TVAG_317300 [Trichomonas vaginalis G3]KAI5512065.1 regulation of translation [Trichomonas vaginalis G3]|eukprot:XP_001305602.1 hypothetical protein [Trichomonas vaginalis G3]
MSVYQQLFYHGKYDKLLNELLAIQDRSVQETHNLAITRYLITGDSPLPELQKLVDSIKAETLAQTSWPTHPSYALLMYHICLYYFRSSNYQNCIKNLNNIWANIDKIDKVIGLCVSLLTIELAIRTGENENIEKAFNFIQSNFQTPESITSLLASKNIDGQIVKEISQNVQYAKLRYDVSQLINKPMDEEVRNQLEEILSQKEITPDSKNRSPMSIAQVLPLACAALRLGDQMRFQTVLETADDAVNFSILNNRGISELLQKRYSSALLHFTKSLNSRPNNELIYPYHQVAYNLGISLLMKHQPQNAFQFLYPIIPLMSRSPYLWLRLAECIVMYYKDRIQELRKQTQVNSVIAKKLSTESRTFYILPLPDNKLFDQYKTQNSNMTLEFAEKCTRNAITLCGYNPQLNSVRRASELLCSFISLELGDGKRAADMGKTVTADNTVDNQQKFLAKIYSAQGHLMVGESEESSKILSRLLIENDLKKEKDQLIRHALTFARVGMATNDTKRVENQLQKVSDTDQKKPEWVLTNIAFELQRRHVRQAHQILLNYCNSNTE